MSGAPKKTAPRTQPVPVRDVIAQTIATMTTHRQAAAVDFPTWKALVGAKAARYTQPTAVRQGRLVVHVADAASLYELSLNTPALLAGVRQALPNREIREIRLSLGTVQW